MTEIPSKKLTLLNTLPEGLLVDRAWFTKHGLTRPDIDYYLRAGYFQTVQRGLYRKPGAPLKWQHIAYSLLEMNLPLHIGGKTALAEKGLTHYLELGQRDIQLFSEDKLPSWLKTWHQQHNSDFSFSLHTKKWQACLPDELFWSTPFGNWDWPIRISQPELAIIEWLSDAKTEVDLKVIDVVFEGLTTLSPKKVMLVLQKVNLVQTRRLFGWFCDRHPHNWVNRIDWQAIDLGKGKRSFIKGGTFNTKWQITLPPLWPCRLVKLSNGYGFCLTTIATNFGEERKAA